jgi:putative transposase
MSRSKHTEAQVIGALKQLEAGRKPEDVAQEVGVSKYTIYTRKAKYGGLDGSQRKRRSICAMKMRDCGSW